MSTQQAPVPLRIDIVSDVVCPWCVIGYKQLQRALDQQSDPGIVFRVAALHDLRQAADAPHQVEDVVEEDPFQQLAPLGIADVDRRHQGEGLAAPAQGGPPDLEVDRAGRRCDRALRRSIARQAIARLGSQAQRSSDDH